MTTPDRLAEALADTAASYTAELPGITPNPELGHRLTAHARRIRQRIQPGDPRMTAFTPHTDATGYPWLPQPAHDYLTDTTNTLWSFDRWFTGLAQAAARADAPDADQLAALAAEAAEMRKLAQTGMRLTEARRGPETTTYTFRK